MKNNSRERQSIIWEESKKYFIIGFIVGVIPFVIIIMILNSTNHISNIEHLKMVVPIMGIITAFVNGFILQYKVRKKLLQET